MTEEERRLEIQWQNNVLRRLFEPINIWLEMTGVWTACKMQKPKPSPKVNWQKEGF